MVWGGASCATALVAKAEQSKVNEATAMFFLDMIISNSLKLVQVVSGKSLFESNHHVNQMRKFSNCLPTK